jgi:hypothetical protein
MSLSGFDFDGRPRANQSGGGVKTASGVEEI